MSQIPGQAQSALINAPPNDRRASARPRPLSRVIRPDTPGRLPAGSASLRVSARRARRRRPRPKWARSAASLASVSFANRAALQTALLDDRGRRRSLGGTRCRLRRPCPPTRRAARRPDPSGLTWIRRDSGGPSNRAPETAAPRDETSRAGNHGLVPRTRFAGFAGGGRRPRPRGASRRGGPTA